MSQFETYGVMWEDVTTYSQGDKIRTLKIYHARVGGNPISVYKHHHYGDAILLSAITIGFDNYTLKSTDFESAAVEALQICAKRLKTMLEAFPDAVRN